VVSGVFSIPLDASERASKLAGAKGRTARLPLAEFIGGEENLLARAAAESLLERPERFNPLVFFGPTGVGKSHLALGLAARWKDLQRGRRAVLTTGADFARAYAAAVDADAVSDWREKNLSADLLLIDDVHDLVSKRAAQHELLQLVDAFVAASKPLVVTSLELPSEAAGFSEPLASRLSSGLSVPLAAPGTPARRVILLKLAALHEVPLKRSAIQLLAERLSGTVPSLNHAVVELERAGRSRMNVIDEETIAEYLAEQLAKPSPKAREISQTTAKYFRLKEATLRGPSRRAGVVHARGLAMYLVRRLTDQTLEQIGASFGGRDHTTVLHACRKYEALVETDSDTRHEVEDVIQLVEYRNSSRF
jgi:chromosomal replication initiator protein